MKKQTQIWITNIDINHTQKYKYKYMKMYKGKLIQDFDSGPLLQDSPDPIGQVAASTQLYADQDWTKNQNLVWSSIWGDLWKYCLVTHNPEYLSLKLIWRQKLSSQMWRALKSDGCAFSWVWTNANIISATMAIFKKEIMTTFRAVKSDMHFFQYGL